MEINWPPIYGFKEPEFISRVFKVEDVKNNVITIEFIYNGDKHIIASCKLYGDPEVINTCNKIISTFNLIEKKILLTNEQIIKAIRKISKLKNIRYNGSYGDYGLDEKDNKLLIFSKISDLNNDGAPEIIFETVNYDKNMYKLFIVSVNSQTDESDKISESRLSNSWLLGDIKDINGDGIKEIFMEPEGRGGFANRHGYSVLAVNFKELKTSYVQIKNPTGTVLDYFEFEGGGSTGRCNYDGWILGKNLNNQNYIISFESIVKNGGHCIAEDGQNNDNRLETDFSLCAKCKIVAYKWNGSVFSFDEQAGETLRKSINLEEFDGNDCRTCEWWEK